MKTDIIARILAYDNQMMVNYLESLKRAMHKPEEPQTARKSKSKVKPVRITPTSEHLDRINRSIDFYTNAPEYKYVRETKTIKNMSEQTIPSFDDFLESFDDFLDKQDEIAQNDDHDADEEDDDDDDVDSDDEFISDGVVKFRDYQTDIIKSGVDILKQHGFLYLAMQVRTGKTLTALGICNSNIGVSNVLFLTKKKAISSIQRDYDALKPWYSMVVINYESVHKIDQSIKFDVIILDEAHSMGAFAKPSKRAKDVALLISKHRPRVILMSGTPTPESYSQMYHQVYSIPNNPFMHCKNFYRFADEYVDVKTKMINSMPIKDYSRGKDSIIQAMEPFTIRYTQQEAGFMSVIDEEIRTVKMMDSTYLLAEQLKRDKVVEGENVILADTEVKLMMKLHQIYSGTVKFEGGDSMVIDYSKAEYIFDEFKGNKIGIFYKFKEELNALKDVFGHELTESIDDFDAGKRVIALQIVSGREGISLKNAEYLVYYNIDFSATSYWQSRDRMTTIDRLENKIIWIFSVGGIEKDIYKAVVKKKDYTVRHFRKDLTSNNI